MKKILFSIFLLITPTLMMAQGWPSDYKGVMLQGFYWNSYSETSWTKLASQTDELSRYFDLVWIPQSAKATASTSMGYDDLYWFTNYNSSFGTEAELRSLIKTFQAAGIGTIADVVINHRGNVSSWVDFPAETYNGVTYQLQSTDICANDDGGATKTWATANGYSLSSNNDTGEGWSGMRDLDHNSANVQTNVKAYLNMLLNDLGYAGFRYDMTKGYGGKFTGIYNSAANPTYSVGEYWDGNQSNVAAWLNATKVNDNIMSAAFDFPVRYTVRDAVNNGVWSTLATGSGLCKDATYNRYAVTFVENHDTETRSASEVQDPIKKDTLAANAYILSMPGTPCVFYKHWLAYKSEIGAMIKIRKAVGISNKSLFSPIRYTSSYYIMQTTGTVGKLITIFGDVSTAESSYNPVDHGFVKVLSGHHYAMYTSGVTDFAGVCSVDKSSGSYDNSVTVTITPAGGTAVYTTDGSTPTAANGTKITSATKLTFNENTTLKVGMLNNGTVTDMQTYTYTISVFQPYDITVYVKDPGWTTMYFHTWGDYRTGTAWPGTKITATKTINGATWYYQSYTMTRSDDYVNFVFNQGGSTTQTVDVDGINKDTYFEISTSKDGNGHYLVNDVTSTTGINSITAEKSSGKYWYSLSGVRYNGKPSAPGIYVHEGKKVVLR
jgi:alpha-amylase